MKGNGSTEKTHCHVLIQHFRGKETNVRLWRTVRRFLIRCIHGICSRAGWWHTQYRYFQFFYHSSASTCFLFLCFLSQWVRLTFTWSHYFVRSILWIRFDYCLVVSGPCSCLYRSDRPLPNARRHATWQLLSLALHFSLCEAAVEPVWEVKRKQFWCREARLIFCYMKYHILCRLFTYTCHSGW